MCLTGRNPIGFISYRRGFVFLSLWFFPRKDKSARASFPRKLFVWSYGLMVLMVLLSSCLVDVFLFFCILPLSLFSSLFPLDNLAQHFPLSFFLSLCGLWGADWLCLGYGQFALPIRWKIKSSRDSRIQSLVSIVVLVDKPVYLYRASISLMIDDGLLNTLPPLIFISTSIFYF